MALFLPVLGVCLKPETKRRDNAQATTTATTPFYRQNKFWLPLAIYCCWSLELESEIRSRSLWLLLVSALCKINISSYRQALWQRDGKVFRRQGIAEQAAAKQHHRHHLLCGFGCFRSTFVVVAQRKKTLSKPYS